MNRIKLTGALGLVLALLIVTTTLAFAATFALLITGAGVVNGSPDEWGAFNESNPYFITYLCVNGDCTNTSNRLGRLFMHYTCEGINTVFMAVTPITPTNTYTANTNNSVILGLTNAVVTADTTPFTTNPSSLPNWRDFTTVGTGFEASSPFTSPQTISLTVQAIFNGGTLATTGNHNYIIPSCVPTAVTLADFGVQSSTLQLDGWLGAVGILGLISTVGLGIWTRRRKS